MKIQDEELAEAAAEIIKDTIDTLGELGVEQDYAAYLLLSAGMGLAIMGNRRSPVVTTQLLAAAMMVANTNIVQMDMENEEEEQEDEDDRPHKYH